MEQKPHFELERCGHGAVFTITREQSLNAITMPVLHGLARALDDLEREGARYLVITGRGSRALSAGTDLSEVRDYSAGQSVARADLARDLLVRLSHSSLVSICAMNGLAYGGGLELAMACTLRLAAPHVTMALPEIKLGLVPSYGGTQFLPALVGKGRALDLMLTARSISAEEALGIGLVSRIVGSGDMLLPQAIALGEELAAYSPTAIAAIRTCVATAGGEVIPAGLAAERAAVAAISPSGDAREGISAFLEKRRPTFTGR